MAGALSHPPRIFFPDAVTGKTVDGPFKIPTDVSGPDLFYSLIFSPDDKFLFLDDLTNGFLLNKDVLWTFVSSHEVILFGMNNLLLLEKESTFIYPLEFTTCVSAGPVKTSNV